MNREVARHRLWLAVILAVAIGTRALCMLYVPASNSDTQSFFALARGVLDGHGFSTALTSPFVPSFERPPAYPLFIAAVHFFTRDDSDRAVVIAQVTLDVIAVVLIFVATRARFGVQVARLAALFYALLPFGAGLASQLLAESIAIALVATALVFESRARSTSRPLRWSFVGGLAWGCASLARPYVAPLAAVAAIAAGFELAATRGVRKFEWASAIALSAGAFCAVAPWAARNAFWAHEMNVPFVVYQPLGSRAPFTTMYTPGFLYWMRSYEEPMIWADSTRAPEGPYLDDDERRRIAVLFERLTDRHYVVDDRLDQAFYNAGQQRRRAAPFRCYVWRRLSSVGKLWLAPRLSSIGRTVTGANSRATSSLWLLLCSLALSWSLTALAVLGFIAQRTRAVLYPGALLIAITAILVEVGLSEARYLMVMLPVICMLAGSGATFIGRRLAA